MIKHIILTLLFFLLANVLVWYQLNSQLVWDWAKSSNSMWLMALLGIPISLLFWWCTKIGYAAFGSLWQVRILGFAMSMLTFPIMTWIYLGEAITLKTFVSIALAVIIIILQLL